MLNLRTAYMTTVEHFICQLSDCIAHTQFDELIEKIFEFKKPHSVSDGMRHWCGSPYHQGCANAANATDANVHLDFAHPSKISP